LLCPHCNGDIKINIHKSFIYQRDEHQINHDLEITLGSCPKCKKPIVFLRNGECFEIDGITELVQIENEEILFPKKM